MPLSRKSTQHKRQEASYNYADWLSVYLQEIGKPAKVILDFNGNANDFLHNHDGSVSGSPSFGADPLVDDDGSCVNIGEVSGNRVEIENKAELVPQTGSYTYLGWWYWDGDSGDQDWLFRIGGANGDVYLRQASGLHRCAFTDENSNSKEPTDSLSSGVVLQAGVIDRGNDVVKAWANGSKAEGDASAIGNIEPVGALTLGSQSGGGSELPDRLDVFAAIPYALSDSELQKAYDVGLDRSNR